MRRASRADIHIRASTIGKDNMGLLRKVYIVCRKKSDAKYASTELIRVLKCFGLRTTGDGGEAVVTVIRKKYPGCFCESCIRLDMMWRITFGEDR